MATKNTLAVIEESKSQCYGRLSSPIFLHAPAYGRGHTPQWSTYESMEIDFEMDDFSDDDADDDEYINLAYLNDIEYDENKDQNNGHHHHHHENHKKMPRGSVPPSVKLNHSKQHKSKGSIRLKNRASVPPNTLQQAQKQKESKHKKSASVPIKEIKHFAINQLTVICVCYLYTAEIEMFALTHADLEQSPAKKQQRIICEQAETEISEKYQIQKHGGRRRRQRE